MHIEQHCSSWNTHQLYFDTGLLLSHTEVSNAEQLGKSKTYTINRSHLLNSRYQQQQR